ncbi:MAG: hypothetical protein WD851_21600 [Pirellulales bacterium]
MNGRSPADHKRIAEKLRNLSGVQAALKRAARQAIREHAITGDPIAVWRDNKVVWITPKLEDYPPLDDAP